MSEDDLDSTVLMPKKPIDLDATILMPKDLDSTVLMPLPKKRQGQVLFLPGQSPEGDYILSILLKRTYDITSEKVCKRAEEDRPIISGDTPWGNPMNSTIKFESDFVPYKLKTDVVLNGKAYAPQGKPIESLVASIKIGTLKKEILVTGDRQAFFVKNGTPSFSDPNIFTEMDLRYEKAYGGIDVYSDKSTSYPYPRNMLGRGFVVKNSKESVNKLELPNIEAPDDRITPARLCTIKYDNWINQPKPTGLGWFPKQFQPRAGFAGILPADRSTEQELRKAYAKLLPKGQRKMYLENELPDIDFKFFNGASDKLAMDYLRGNEYVETSNLDKEGDLNFRLPRDYPKIGIDFGRKVKETNVVMHTLMINMEEKQIDIVWRGAVVYPEPDWLKEMSTLNIIIT